MKRFRQTILISVLLTQAGCVASHRREDPPPGVTVEIDRARSSQVLKPGKKEVVFVVKRDGRLMESSRLRLIYTEVCSEGGEKLGDCNLAENIVSSGPPVTHDPMARIAVRKHPAGILAIHQKEAYPTAGVVVERGKRYWITARALCRAPDGFAFDGEVDSAPYLISVE